MAAQSNRSTPTRSPGKATPRQRGAAAKAKPDATSVIDMMKQQHRDIEALLTQLDAEKNLQPIVEEICTKWTPHTLIEEQILLPALEENGATEPALAEATVRRDLVKLLLAELRDDASGPEAAAKFAVLASALEQLIELEEREAGGVFALAEVHGVDFDTLKPQVEARTAEIEADPEGEVEEALEPNSLRLQLSRDQQHHKEYSSMPYDSNVRDRDERGRFESERDSRGGYRSNDRDRDERGRFESERDSRGGYRGNDRDRDERGRFESERDSRGGYRGSDRDRDERESRGGNRGNERERDEYGRFVSEDDRGYRSRSSRDRDDDNRRSSSSRGGYDEDRRGGGGDRGQGGWFGDSEGHSEASRRGWENREGAGYSSRSSRDDDDDRRGGGGGGGGRDRGQGGWFGDREGHSEASRRGWENREGSGYSSRSSRDDDDDRRGGGGGGRDRGQGGWFGDSEGHSEAAREGWEERRGGGGGGGGREGYRSRSSRDDDDDRRGGGGGGGRGRGQGGWFGDSEGHSEASRRGWEDRR